MGQENTTPKDGQLEELVRHLADTETAIREILGGEVDGVVDPLSGAPILLRRAQVELLEMQKELERKVKERTAALRNANAELQATNEELLALNEELAATEESLRQQNLDLEAARRLIEQERARYQALFDLAPDGYLVTDARGTIHEANVAAGTLLGEAPDQLCGQRVAEFAFGADRRLLQDQLQRIRLQRRWESWRWEMRVQPAAGRAFHADITAAPVRIEGGQVTGIRWLVRDITERKRAEAALVASEERLRLVADFTYDWEYWTGTDGHYIYISPSVERITGYRPEEFYNDPALLQRIVHADDRQLVAEHRRERERKRVAHALELRIVSRDGQVRWIGHACQPVYRDDGTWLGTRGSNRDITERKRAEARQAELLEAVRNERDVTAALAARIEQEWNLLDTIMENTATGLAYLDPAFHFVRVNQAYASQSGYHPAELIGRDHFALFPNDQNRAIFERVRDSGEPVEFKARAFEFSGQPERGTTYWDWTLVPVKDQVGEVRGLVLSLTDVTDRVGASRQREAHLASLSALLRCARDVVAEQTVEGLLQRVIDGARELTGGRLGTAGHGYRSGEFVILAQSRAQDAPECPGPEVFTVGQGGVYVDILDSAAPIHLRQEELEAHPSYRGLPEGHAPLRGLLGARLVNRNGQGDGVIMLTDKEAGDEFSAEDAALLGQLAAVASLALQHIETRHDAERRANELDAVFEAMVESVIVYDAAGVPVKANRAAVDAHGMDPVSSDRQVLAERMAITHPDGRRVELDETTSGRALGGERVTAEPFMYVNASGEERAVVTSGAPLKDDGKVTGAVVVWHDVTEQVQATQRLQQSEEKLRALFDILPVGASVLDAQGNIAHSNEALSRLLGLSIDALRHGDYQARQYLRPGGTPMPGDELPSRRALVEQREVRGVEIGVVKEDGGTIWTHVSATPLPFEDWRVLVATVDITERLQMQEALRRAHDELEERVVERTRELRDSEERFRQLAEHIEDVFWLVDPIDATLLYVSPAYEAVWGRPATELYERPEALFDAVHPDDRERVIDLLGNIDYAADQEFRILRPDGCERWIRSRAFPVHDADARPYRIAGVASDITRDRQAQLAMIKAERLSMAGQMAASLAHEINNPLQGASGCLELMREAIDEGEDPSPYVDVAHEALSRAGRTVSQLRTLHRGPVIEEKQVTDVNSLVEESLVLMRKKASAQGVDLDWKPGSDLTQVALMRDGVHQVFLNLIVNALDAMPAGGRLKVRTERVDRPLGVRIVFADTGPGLAPEIANKIFEPFQTTKADGTGLGLFLSQNTVERHGGQIHVESTKRGTTVTVSLPV